MRRYCLFCKIIKTVNLMIDSGVKTSITLTSIILHSYSERPEKRPASFKSLLSLLYCALHCFQKTRNMLPESPVSAGELCNLSK